MDSGSGLRGLKGFSPEGKKKKKHLNDACLFFFLSPLLSVPCGPEDVRASVACVTGALVVTWNISVPAENYTTVISRGMGQSLHCNSTETQCTTGGLSCGSSYRVIVLSVTGSCLSLPSTEVTVQTREKHTKVDTDRYSHVTRLNTESNFSCIFISLQCRVLPPTSQPCTRVLQLSSLCHGWPATVPITTLLLPRAAEVTGQSAPPVTPPVAFLRSSVGSFTPLAFLEPTTTAQVN